MRSRPLSALSPESIVTMAVALALACGSGVNARAATFADRSCGTPDPPLDQAQSVQQALDERAEAGGGEVSGVVQVAFHVIYNGVDGNVTDAQIQQQIAELNLDFSGAYGGYDTGYRFVLTSVDRTLNADWFNLVMGSNNEKRMKEALAVDPTHHVNVYTANISALGWSSFPWGVAEGDVHQGIVVHYGSLPGGDIVNFNLGRTVTHEMGHYFGLLHTFFTGCLEPNDYVDDTPAEAQQTTGCPQEPWDTCSLPGLDPIHNYLDYSYDSCYSEFTPGQDVRMDGMITTYRPNFLTGPLAVAPERKPWFAVFRPVAPNPSRGPVRLAFSLRRDEDVTLRVHDLAGRLVATLADGWMTAGDYTRTFKSPRGASGVYFAELDAGADHLARRVVLTH